MEQEYPQPEETTQKKYIRNYTGRIHFFLEISKFFQKVMTFFEKIYPVFKKFFKKVLEKPKPFGEAPRNS